MGLSKARINCLLCQTRLGTDIVSLLPRNPCSTAKAVIGVLQMQQWCLTWSSTLASLLLVLY